MGERGNESYGVREHVSVYPRTCTCLREKGTLGSQKTNSVARNALKILMLSHQITEIRSFYLVSDEDTSFFIRIQ